MSSDSAMNATCSKDDAFEEQASVPLLQQFPSVRSSDGQIVPVIGEEDQTLTAQTLEESKKVWKIVGPTTVFRMASYSMVVVSQAFAGHIGDLELAAISIGYNVIMGLDFGFLVCLFFFAKN